MSTESTPKAGRMSSGSKGLDKWWLKDEADLRAAPYLARFPSGESVLAYNQGGLQRVCLGDREAREFGDPETFLPGNGFWGSIVLAGPRQLVTTMPTVRSDGNKIMIGVLDLIRR